MGLHDKLGINQKMTTFKSEFDQNAIIIMHNAYTREDKIGFIEAICIHKSTIDHKL